MVGRIIQIEPSQDAKVKVNRCLSELPRYINLACQSNKHKEGRYQMWWSAVMVTKFRLVANIIICYELNVVADLFC
jgi:hypothetical protein